MIKLMNKQLDKQLTIDIIRLRDNPRRDGFVKPKSKSFKGHLNETAGEGRIVLAYMLYITRKIVLDTSFQRFANLVCEDRKREHLLIGNVKFNEINDVEDIHGNTIMRVEDCKGEYGADVQTLALIAPRLADPDTNKAFTPLDLIALVQGFAHIDIARLKSPDYIRLVRKVNAERDASLYY